MTYLGRNQADMEGKQRKEKFGNRPRNCLVYQADQGKIESQREESNLRPTDYESVALPTELRWLRKNGK
jgi:hypothetical protein